MAGTLGVECASLGHDRGSGCGCGAGFVPRTQVELVFEGVIGNAMLECSGVDQVARALWLSCQKRECVSSGAKRELDRAPIALSAFVLLELRRLGADVEAPGDPGTFRVGHSAAVQPAQQGDARGRPERSTVPRARIQGRLAGMALPACTVAHEPRGESGTILREFDDLSPRDSGWLLRA